MDLQYLITGTGRCGTGYAAEVLRAAGVACGHEEMYGFHTTNLFGEVRHPAESSWLAAPFLDDVGAQFPGLRVVQLVRHPRDVIASLMTKRFFTTPSEYLDFVRRYLPGVGGYSTPLEKAAYFYVEWNQMIKSYRVPVVRLEDGPENMLRRLGIDCDGVELPTKPVNVGRDPVELDLETLPKQLRALLDAISQEYGYDLSKSRRNFDSNDVAWESPRVFWALLMERSVQQEAVSALMDVAMTAGAIDAMRIGLPYTRTDQARNRICGAFMEVSDHPDDVLIMLDCDHAHPPDIIPRLAARREGVVGALAFRRSPPHEPMWFVRQENGRLLAPAEYEPLLYECDAVGTGAVAIKRWVLDKLRDQGADYFFRYDYLDGGYSPSEDMYFAGLCEKAGIKHHVDCTLVTPHLASLAVDDGTWTDYRQKHTDILMEV